MSHIQVPLVIGVTGHRDLRRQDVPALQDTVRKVLDALRQAYKSTPFILLSSLAEGADRLVAQLALEDSRTSLIVPLPLPITMYETDFKFAESRLEFHQLLEKAQSCFEVVLHPISHAAAEDGPARDLCYEAAGRYIAEQSQILIALWDGKPSDKTGGTSDVVHLQLEGSSTGSNDLNPPELFPVYQVVTPRVSNPEPEGQPFELIKRYPAVFASDTKAAEYYASIFGNVEQFNAQLAAGSYSLLRDAAEGKSALLQDFDETQFSPAEALELKRYALADALARRLQRRKVTMYGVLHVCVFAAFALLVFFAHLPWHPALLLCMAFVVLLWGIFRHRRARRDRLDDASQDYRAIAEGCRVRFFWELAGIHESVADHYLGKQRTELDWIRNGLRGWGIGRRHPRVTSHDRATRLEAVLKLWVHGQMSYFRKTAATNEHKLHRNEKLARIFVSLGLVTVSVVLACAAAAQAWHKEWWSCPECHWVDAPVIVIDICLVVGALLHNYTRLMAYSEHMKQYKRMRDIFSRSHRLVRQSLGIGDFNGAQQFLRKLGQEALSESGDWVMIHRERPLELPHP